MDASLLKTLVTHLLTLLNVEVGAVEVKTGHRTVVAVTTPEASRLIGPAGENLKALNTIARRLVESKHGAESAAFLIDVNGHHETEMEKVRQNARLFAQRARLFKHDVELAPMSSYERLVVHELFSDDPEIKTESAGEGKFRHVVLKHKDSKTASK